MKKKHILAIIYGLVLTAFTVYVVLDTFVITRVYGELSAITASSLTSGAEIDTGAYTVASSANEASEAEDASDRSSADGEEGSEAAGGSAVAAGESEDAAGRSDDATGGSTVDNVGGSDDAAGGLAGNTAGSNLATDGVSSATTESDTSSGSHKPSKGRSGASHGPGSSSGGHRSSSDSENASEDSGSQGADSDAGSSASSQAQSAGSASSQEAGSGSAGSQAQGTGSASSQEAGSSSVGSQAQGTGSASSQEVTGSSTSQSSTTGTSTQAGTVSTASSYQDENVTITLTEYTVSDTTVYVADVQLSTDDLLKTALAHNAYGKNVTQKTSEMAEENNAILAINGDYYGAQETGYVLRNGVLLRSTAEAGQEDLVIWGDGSFSIINESEVTAEELLAQGAVQILSFGPALVTDGEVAVSAGEEVGKAMASNPRTAIGIIDEGHYLFVVSDGRTAESEGLSLSELASFMQSLGAETAYNLDGGGSSTMYFNGEIVNNPTTNGNSVKERSVSDIVYIGY